VERQGPTIDLDHHAPEYAAGSVGILKDLRTRCPVAYSDNYGGMWVVSDYDHIVEVIKDDTTYSSSYEAGTIFDGITIPSGGARMRNVPIEMDPPDFFAYRRMLNPWFSPAAVARVEPKLRRVVDAVIDEVIESGRIDLVLDLANPVPAIMTLDLLGLPLEDWDLYARTAHTANWTRPYTPERERAMIDLQAVMDKLAEAIATRRANPEEDLVSFLVGAEVEGRRLSDDEVLEIVSLVFQGGVDTTTSLMANALLYLHQDRDARKRLIDEPDLRRLACEEFLRFVSPIQTLARTVTTDTELGGCRLNRGDRILIAWAGANRDEKVFDRPDEVVLDRYPNRHLAFGVGIHRCIGSNLARAQFLAVLDAVLTRLPDYEVIDEEVQRYPAIGMVHGMITIPATFTPGKKTGQSIFA
jgi:cytochrome P450